MAASLGLTAPLFTLDQCVHLTAPQGQGEGGERRGAVLFRLRAKGFCSWQSLRFVFVCFVCLFVSYHVVFYWYTPKMSHRDTHQVYQQLKDDAMLQSGVLLILDDCK